ncbi:MAG: hypothetical protein KC474_06940 [Cyanobacteria bacterium HKST-UBA04]|nr:hypothetical protein [Cyanobacteria bacterium HKST-UBA05]MCA9799268.1 hypothetical protein [Cyanobacteria bacterium HKST-UBA04]MCA9841238.1 hypothetical protein [Cyanobacteria bacterium HKST-UBA03]
MGTCSSCSGSDYRQPYINERLDFYQYHADAAREVNALRKSQAVHATDDRTASQKPSAPRPVVNDAAATVSLSQTARQLSQGQPPR